MDAKITKKRLSDFFAYEWILTLVTAVAAIFLLELVFTVSATKITTGQQFKYYYDQGLYDYSTNGDSFYYLLGVKLSENGKTFSYDILSVDNETLLDTYDVLSVRLSVQEGDMIFTSRYEDAENGTLSRAKIVADSYSVYDFEKLLKDAKEYLLQFVKEGGNIYEQSDIDEKKVIDHFNERMKKDKRFRTEEQKAEGRTLEIGRIKKLSADVRDFEKLLSLGKDSGLFFIYTKYEQSKDNDDKDGNYKKAYENEIENGKQDLIYGLDLGALGYSGDGTGRKLASEYFKLSGSSTAENVVLMAFDFLSYQPDLQFEAISFIDTVVRSFSDILD